MNPGAVAAVAFYGLAVSFTAGYVLDPSDWYLRLATGSLVSAVICTGYAWLAEATATQRTVTVEAMALAGKAVILGVCVVIAASTVLLLVHDFREERRRR